ncbi:hypothetical protein EJB05_27810, partial [Eragrostis curvula]
MQVLGLIFTPYYLCSEFTPVPVRRASPPLENFGADSENAALSAPSLRPSPPPLLAPCPHSARKVAVPVEERRSLAVPAGELFLGLAALLMHGAGRCLAAPAVEEVEARDGVVWEQDVEAERRSRELTSLGFSFSAAGLLFPYHIGVGQILRPPPPPTRVGL